MIINDSHPFITTCPEVNEIISPLKKIGFNFFGYKRCYKDGSRFYLNANADFMDYYFNERKCHTFAHTESYPEGDKTKIALWATINQHDLYQEAKERFDIDHGIYLIQPYQDYFELFSFATNSNNPTMLNQYFSNLEYLFNFSNSFKDQAADLIKQSQSKKIISDIQNVEIGSEFDSLQSSKVEFKPDVKLSKRQLECIKYMLLGKTTPEIASILRLSSRTIESYVNSLKVKFHCKNKTELIIKLLKYYGK